MRFFFRNTATEKLALDWSLLQLEICQTGFCKEVDSFVDGHETTASIMLGKPVRKEIHRNPGDKDCEKRITLDREVSVKVCIKAKCRSEAETPEGCEHFKPNPVTCLKYLDEVRHKHKPTKFNKPHRIDRRGAVGGWHYRDV